MTPSQVALVREGYARIAPRSDSVCLAFCRRLFELDLSLRTLFPSDLRPLTTTLAAALETLVRSLDDLQPVLVRGARWDCDWHPMKSSRLTSPSPLRRSSPRSMTNWARHSRMLRVRCGATSFGL
jgi:hypothetical protein